VEREEKALIVRCLTTLEDPNGWIEQEKVNIVEREESALVRGIFWTVTLFTFSASITGLVAWGLGWATLIDLQRAIGVPVGIGVFIALLLRYSPRMHMNGWNRLFVVIAVCWAVVAPFLFVAETNDPPERIYHLCIDRAYQIYGTADSPRLDMKRYNLETGICLEELKRGLAACRT
jgi:hypothetical protein